MRCPESWVGLSVIAFGAGVLIGGLLPCLAVKWLCGLGLIAAGVLFVRK